MLFVDEAESGSFVDAAGGDQDIVGPEGDLAIPNLATEVDALVHQASAEAQATRPGLDQEKTKLGDRLRLPDQENRADELAVQLGQPAALRLGLKALNESGR